jgi:hypothetical protein
MFSCPIRPAVEDVLITTPPPVVSIAAMPYLRTWNTPLRSTAVTRSQLSSSISCSGCCRPSTPALLKMTSIRP